MPHNEEIERVKLQREAVERTIDAVWPLIKRGGLGYGDWEGSEPLAARLYPMPTVEVPREFVASNGTTYSVHDGVLFGKRIDCTWEKLWWKVSDIRGLLDILENPTEQRSADQANRNG